ncbi:hypothetical protein VR010_11995 [Actinomycetaceae bacterium L2_0104]
MTWEWWLVLAVAIIAIFGIVVTFRARRLDALNRTVAKSRRALEHALTARAQYAHDFATCGALDMAGAILLTDSADTCLREGMQPIIDDGLDRIEQFDFDRPEREARDRRDLESNLSRTLRLTVDELDASELAPGQQAFYDRLEKARLEVKMTRNFHNSHVAQVRRVRATILARIFPIAGRAPWPQTVDMDDAE